MNILFVCQYYYPEPFRHPDICEALVKKGHNVTVVTGVPNYPMGEIYDGYKNGGHSDEVLNGVKVHRCFTVGRKSGTLFRFLNYYSFALSSTLFVKRLKERFDVVFVNQLSPVMMANAGIAYKKKHNAPLVMYCLDLWPESLIAGGITRESFIYKFFKRVSKRIYRSADKILVTSKSFGEYFKKEFGIDGIEYLPQYAEDIFTPENCAKTPDGNIDLMFAGNVGAVQSVDTIIKAAELTKDIKNLRWHIVGDGSDIEHLKTMAANMPQVNFHGRQPLENMPAFYAMADAMLVTMKRDSVLSMTLPGKVQTYMAAGKPIIASIDGEARRVINEAQCGIAVEADNADELAQAVRNFIAADFAAYATNAKKHYDMFFSKLNMISALEKSLTDAVK